MLRMAETDAEARARREDAATTIKTGRPIITFIRGAEYEATYARRKALEEARDAVCPRCERMTQGDPDYELGEGEYTDRHVFCGDVLATCLATPIRALLEETNNEWPNLGRV